METLCHAAQLLLALAEDVRTRVQGIGFARGAIGLFDDGVQVHQDFAKALNDRFSGSLNLRLGSCGRRQTDANGRLSERPNSIF